MNLGDLVTVVQTVGFPIAMCALMAWYVKYTEDRHREERREILQQHENEIASINTALDNNTAALYTMEKAIILLTERGGYNENKRD